MLKNGVENRWAHEFVFVWPWTISSLYVTFSHVDDDRRWCCGESKYIFFVMVQTKKIFSMINTQTVYVLLVKISCILFTKYWRFIVLCCCVVPFLLLEIYHYFKNEKRVFFCQLCDGFVIVVDSHSYSLVRFEFPFFKYSCKIIKNNFSSCAKRSRSCSSFQLDDSVKNGQFATKSHVDNS